MSKVLPVRQGVGIDVSKDTLQVCMSNLEVGQRLRVRASKKLDNTPSGWKQLTSWLAKHRLAEVPLFIVLEATGIYHEEVLYHLQAQGEHVSVVLPRQAKAYAKSLNTRSKTDALDAQVLAYFAAERALPAWRPPFDNLRRLKRLCRERVALQEHKTRVQNQAHARAYSHAPETDARRRSEALLRLLEKQILQVETQIEKTIAADADLQRKVQQICKVKGLGLITVATIVAETDGFALFTRKGQVVRFAGYDVVVQQSGTSVKGLAHISHQGSKYIRRALHFPALSVVKYEKHFRDLFDRVSERTGIKMKGYVAVQRKLLVLIYTLFKTDAEYDRSHVQQKKAAVQKNRQELLPA